MRTLIEAFMTGSYCVQRSKGQGEYVNGYFVPGSIKEFRIRGSLQPVTGRELMNQPEGERVKQTWKLYTDQRLVTAREFGLHQADVVIVNNEKYKVTEAERWQNTDLDYFKHTLVKIYEEVEGRES